MKSLSGFHTHTPADVAGVVGVLANSNVRGLIMKVHKWMMKDPNDQKEYDFIDFGLQADGVLGQECWEQTKKHWCCHVVEVVNS